MSKKVTEREGKKLRSILGKSEDPTSLVKKLHSVMKDLEPQVDDIIATAVETVKKRKGLAKDDGPADSKVIPLEKSMNSPREISSAHSCSSSKIRGERVCSGPQEIEKGEQWPSQRSHAELIRRIDELIDQLIGPLGDAAKNNPTLVKELGNLLQKLGYKINAILEKTPSVVSSTRQSYPEGPSKRDPPIQQTPSVRQKPSHVECECSSAQGALSCECRVARGPGQRTAPTGEGCACGISAQKDIQTAASRSSCFGASRSRPPPIARGYSTRGGHPFRSSPHRSPAPTSSMSRVPGRRWQSNSREMAPMDKPQSPVSRSVITAKCCAQNPCLKPQCKYKFCK